jgi:hypothetical protein
MGDFERDGWTLLRTLVGDMRCCRRRLTTEDATDDDEDSTDVLLAECETLSLWMLLLPR